MAARDALPDYPWDLMAPVRASGPRAHADGIVDLSIGSPVDPTPDVVREALARGDRRPRLPADGRHARAARGDRRVVRAPPRRHRASTRRTCCPRSAPRSSSRCCRSCSGSARATSSCIRVPRIPPTRWARVLVGATPIASDDPAEWPAATRLVWLNTPGQPRRPRARRSTSCAPRVERARELGAVIVSDECYAELGLGGRVGGRSPCRACSTRA